MARKSAVLKVEEDEELDAAQQVYTLSTGYKFVAKAVSSMRLYDASAALVMPEPPKMVVKGGGQTYLTDNYSDPLFVARSEEVQRARNMRSLEVMIRSGIKLHSLLPADEGWLEDLAFDIDLGQYTDDAGKIKDRFKAYLFLRYVAIVTREDFELVANSVSLSGGAVDAAEDSFRGDAQLD